MSAKPKALVLIPWLPDEAKAILDAVADTTYRPPEREHLLAHIDATEALWAHFSLKVDKPAIDRATRLRVVNTATTGTDHFDKQELARRGIPLLSIARDAGLLRSFTATSELTWLLLLACFRHFRGANRVAHAGDWTDGAARFQGRQLHGKTLGVLGLGRLGTITAGFGKGFNMRVLGCDLRDVKVPGVEVVDFETLLAESDAISIHIHLTEANRGLFDAAVLAKMKPGAVLVNTSRGDLIDENALLAALRSGHLAAYGADVVHDEWRTDMTVQPLISYARDHDNLVLTPHIGGSTIESVTDARIFSARKLAHWLTTGQELQMR